MSFEVDAPKLAQGKLSTVDCVAQSLAVGPVFSGAVLGLLLYLRGRREPGRS